jgi:hypothetical protein
VIRNLVKSPIICLCVSHSAIICGYFIFRTEGSNLCIGSNFNNKCWDEAIGLDCWHLVIFFRITNISLIFQTIGKPFYVLKYIFCIFLVFTVFFIFLFTLKKSNRKLFSIISYHLKAHQLNFIILFQIGAIMMV